MEFKLDKSAEEAMDQIRTKGYLDGFFNRGKKVVAVGLNFDSKERQISDYQIEEYSEGGKLFTLLIETYLLSKKLLLLFKLKLLPFACMFSIKVLKISCFYAIVV